ncbi:MAG: hypothetical protein WC496_07590 [Phycisphaerae bacterium]|jgi:hypothetical protein
MGLVELKDEYQVLREEMLHRFEKLYDVEKYGVGSILALIGFSDTLHCEKIIILIVLESLILILGIFVMNEFMMIYRLGTYIAIFSEGKDANSAKWIRISRRGHDCLQAINGNLPKFKLKVGFPFTYGWGSDSAQFAIALLVLLMASWGSWLVTRPAFNWQIIFPILPLIGILFNVLWLVWGVKKYRKTTEENWMKIQKAWGTTTFPDPYENTTNTK